LAGGRRTGRGDQGCFYVGFVLLSSLVSFPFFVLPLFLVNAVLLPFTHKTDIASIRPYLPPSARTGTTYSYDPLPPQSPFATSYDDRYFAALYAGRRGPPGRRAGGTAGAGGGGGGAGLAAMRDGLARLLGLGADGPQVDLDPALRAQLLEELEQLNGAGGMPGGFGDEEEEGDEEWDEEEEGEEDGERGQDLLGRLGALFGGIGGGGAAEAR
jgi:hypothetical protein